MTRPDRKPAVTREEALAYLQAAKSSISETAFIEIGGRSVSERDIIEAIKRAIRTDPRRWG